MWSRGKRMMRKILSSMPNDVPLVNEVQLSNEQLTSNLVSSNIGKKEDNNVGDEESDNKVEEVFDETAGFMASRSGGGIGAYKALEI